jgi:hypothetical protein
MVQLEEITQHIYTGCLDAMIIRYVGIEALNVKCDKYEVVMANRTFIHDGWKGDDFYLLVLIN